MELKRYQQRVIEEARAYLDALKEERQGQNPKYASQEAWERLRPTLKLSVHFHRHTTGAGADLPTFGIKVPTGGGKTLIATQILGQVYKSLLTERNGAGLVLWVVPSDQIYKDTLKALRDRNHFYRLSLEYALSRRVEVWEKDEIARLTPSQLASCLNVLVVKLQGANRQDREALKFFRDSGGNIVQHFPAENDPEAQKALKARIPNLEMLEEDAATGSYLAKTSIGNLVRLCEPVVILDEGHKATSDLARQTIAGFNPRLVVELSATPHRSANVLSRVSGLELLNEQMIKLPINVSNSRQTSWENCLTQARDRREALAALARQHYREGNRLIRPLVLVQVERTGKDQRDTEYIHSEDVKEYLVGRLGVPAECVAIKTSEKDDIERIDLLDENCRIEWIITKAALQEGWDCPFAYILVSLSNTRSKQSMTQLVGRVLRQPFVEKTPYSELNESYVYCLRERAEAVVGEIRNALQKEGYEGDAASVVDRTGESDAGPPMRTALMRPEFRQQYRKPFEGRIFLPQFCVRNTGGDEPLDYFQHLLSRVDVRQFDYSVAAAWDFSQELAAATEQFRRINLSSDALEQYDFQEHDVVLTETDEETRAWLVSNIGLDWFSAKQLRSVVERVCAQLQGVDGKLALARFALLEKIGGLIQRETDAQTQALFESLHESGQLFFGLACLECTFELPAKVERRRLKTLRRKDDSDLQRSLFDFQPDDLNEYERNVALYLDINPEVLWWYRNIVGPDEFHIQGWQRSPLYPDFVVQQGRGGKAKPLVWVIESKGKHLKGSADTEYKRNVARVFEEIGKQVTWQELGEGFDEHCFRFQILDQGDYADRDWREDLNKMLMASLTP